MSVDLRDEAMKLDALVGEPPVMCELFTPEERDWHDRYGMAAEALRLIADDDAGALRAAMGPLWTSFDPQPSWRSLLALAAIKIERAPDAGGAVPGRS